MSELTKEVINVLAKEEDDRILKEVLDYYEFLKWRNQRELESKTIECNEYNDDPEIEIEWFL